MHQRITDRETEDFIYMMLLKYGHAPTADEVEDISLIFYAYMEQIGIRINWTYEEE